MAGIETDDKCPHCGAAVRWRLSVLGTRLRLDADPCPTGNVIVTTTDDHKIRARVLTGPEMPAQQTAFRQHVCPERTPHRPGPPCAVCGRPMHRAIAEQLRWTTHPGCDQEFQAESARLRAQTRKAS